MRSGRRAAFRSKSVPRRPSDFITGAACSGSYILAARDLVTNDIEAQVEAALLDGMVCLTSCDKTPPGHLMAAARLNIPTLLVIGGYQASGMIGNEHVDIEDLFSGAVGAALGKPGKFAMDEMTEQAIRGPGVCAGMATANTMHCVVEASGCACPGRRRCAPTAKRCSMRRAVPERASLRWSTRASRRARCLTEAAFRNAVAMVLGVSGSINAIKHLQATAVEAGTDVDIYALWEEMGRKVPVLSAVRPNGAVRIEQFEDAGGAGAMLKRLAPVLDTSALTVTGQTLAEVLASTPNGDTEIIRPLDNPISAGPSIAILKGTLAPESAVVKLGIRDGSRPEYFDGRAVVYEDTQECDGGHCRGQAREGQCAGVARPGPEGRARDGRRRLAGAVCDRCGGPRA